MVKAKVLETSSSNFVCSEFKLIAPCFEVVVVVGILLRIFDATFPYLRRV